MEHLNQNRFILLSKFSHLFVQSIHKSTICYSKNSTHPHTQAHCCKCHQSICPLPKPLMDCLENALVDLGIVMPGFTLKPPPVNKTQMVISGKLSLFLVQMSLSTYLQKPSVTPLMPGAPCLHCWLRGASVMP